MSECGSSDQSSMVMLAAGTPRETSSTCVVKALIWGAHAPRVLSSAPAPDSLFVSDCLRRGRRKLHARARALPGFVLVNFSLHQVLQAEIGVLEDLCLSGLVLL